MDRKNATLGVVGLRTDRTENELDNEESFQHLCVLQEIGQLLLPGLKQLHSFFKVSDTDDGDAVSAIVIAIQMIAKYCRKLKYRRKIVLITNGKGSIESDPDGIAEIARKIKADDIELVVVGVDFDDPDFGFKEEDKDKKKSMVEGTLKSLVEDCDGIFGTMQEALDELGQPRLKTTKPVHSYRGQLTLGDPGSYDSAICIDVERYPRVMVRRPLSASKYVQRADFSNGHVSPHSSATMLQDADGDTAMTETGQNNLTSVRSTMTYQVEDPEAPGGKRDVNRDELAKGYLYGSTAVHLSESDQNVTKLETQAGLEIIGFIPWLNVGFGFSTFRRVLIWLSSNDIWPCQFHV